MFGCVGCVFCLLSIGTWRVATNGVPVFVSTGPELDVCVTGSGVEFVAFGVFVGVVVTDER